MKETIIYLYLGVTGYFIAYAVIGCLALYIWKVWASHKGGDFWKYSYERGLRRYYPELDNFIEYHGVMWKVLCIIVWPIMVPIKIYVMTKVMNRVTEKIRYYF